MDPFAVFLGIFLLLVVGSNMLAFALGVVRFKELLAGEQEDGDDDLKELICEQEGGDDDLKEVICVT